MKKMTCARGSALISAAPAYDLFVCYQEKIHRDHGTWVGRLMTHGPRNFFTQTCTRELLTDETGKTPKDQGNGDPRANSINGR